MTAYATNQIGQFLGTMAGSWISHAGAGRSDISFLSTSMVYLLLVVAIGALLKMNRTYIEVDRLNVDENLAFVCESFSKIYRLTPREAEITLLLAKGKDRASIAETCCISTETVKTHVKRIYTKLGIHSRKEMIVLIEHILEP